MTASGVITLTTDFGVAAPFAGIMKGVILERFAAARIVDITHEVKAYWPAEAGFWLARSFAYFAPGTVHVAVVDPGVGTARGILAVSAGGHLFLAPDNGLLGLLLAAHADAEVVRLSALAAARFGLARISSTFHGRDLFAPVAAALAAGGLTLAGLGEPAGAWVPFPVAPPAVAAGSVSGVVMAIDRFGNLISNIDAALVAAVARPYVTAGRITVPLARTYGEVPSGEFLALINSFGVLEVARSQGHAAADLGLDCGAPMEVHGGPR